MCPSESRSQGAPAAVTGWAKAFARLFRGGLAQVEELRRQPPLPETADELCAVGKSFGVGEPFVYLGARASENRIKQLSRSGELAQARVIHFASHGLVASETEWFVGRHAEPALVLTPPEVASAEDDGLLTTSEVAGLKLDAEWVILSACNTAAGGRSGGEVLSGLARAFFYAGARALLVSHWKVDSDATVQLVTRMFSEMRARPGLARSEALREAMTSMIASGSRNAHPQLWAAFFVTGEGGPLD